jgi:hypothetical protein
MRRTILLALLALALLSAAAEAMPKKSRYVYMHDRRNGGGLFAFRLDDDSDLVSLEGSPYDLVESSDNTGGISDSLAWSKKRKMLFTVGHDGVTAWDLGDDGVPAVREGSPFEQPDVSPGDGSTNYLSVVAVDKGRVTYVYAAEEGAGVVMGWAFDKDGSSASIDGLPLDVGESAIDLALRGKRHLLVGDYDAGVHLLKIGKGGTLSVVGDTPGEYPITTWFQDLTLDPKGKRILYAIDAGADGLPVMALSLKAGKGLFTEVPGAPFDSGFPDEQDNGFKVLASKGKVLFATTGHVGYGDDDLFPMVRGKKGALVPVGEGQDSGMGKPSVVALDAKGKLLVAGSTQSNELRLFAVDKKTGALTLLDTEDLAGEPAGSGAALFVER